ncbi:Helix-turn-helix domain-containing protein [Flavobacterium aquidurense]|uniref:AraC family transcriptional regulator n=2 Tax=Flavobacterium frigidimaris TaxID=262320 RepID=A0ABX4BUI8_FLAFR|nr:AraC family transcriptional regulator [Flavobacterium frigidimaris]SDZ01073.1 Helix-turn-helix domain-containing protein [Flavobacterium aquidurense]
MDSFNFLKTIAIISVFILFLLVVFLLTAESNKKLSNRLFAGYLILTAVDASGAFISNTIISIHTSIEVFRWTMILLNIPLFYVYVLSLCYEDFQLKTKYLLHCIPFVVLNLILVFRIYSNEFDQRFFFRHHSETAEMIIFQIMIEVQYFLYVIMIVSLLKKYKKIYLENNSFSTNFIYKWLFQITIVFAIVHYFGTFKNILRYTDYHQLLIFVNGFLEIIALIAISWFVLQSLKYSEFFKGITSELKLVKGFTKTHIQKTLIQEEKNNHNIINFQVEMLKKYMIEKKPYLDPSLSLQNLASQINMPARELSILVNSNMNMRFFDFVNQYRIENAMELLQNHSKSDLTALEILYKVGFNSKSSFNTAFKKHTSLTPSEYRKTHSKID